MDKLIALLDSELTNLKASFRLVQSRIEDISAQATERDNYSSHVGHNLASAAAELSIIAGKIEQTVRVIATVKQS